MAGITLHAEEPEDIDAANAFSRSRRKIEAIARVRRSMFRVIDPGGVTLGTALLVGRVDPSGEGILVTADHVVQGTDSVRLYGDSDPDPIPAEREAFTPPLRARVELGGNGRYACRPDPDLAILLSPRVPEGARQAHCVRPSDLARNAGTDVVCAGYPLVECPSAAVFVSGMVACSYGRRDREQHTYVKYVIDGMISKGMSGGPVFEPDEGTVVGLVTDALPYPQLGHGWSLATPIGVVVHAIQSWIDQVNAARSGP